VDIAAWLRELGLERYEEAFRENEIDAEVLPRLTAEDLTSLGVTAIGHRRKLLDAIAAARTGDHAPASAPPVGDRPEVPTPALPEGERRQVAVLFADLAGYTAMSQELDAEEVHTLLSRFFDRADRIVEDHGGRVDKHIGDCVMAVFGAPIAHGNDAARAVRSALALRDAMPELAAVEGRGVGVDLGVGPRAGGGRGQGGAGGRVGRAGGGGAAPPPPPPPPPKPRARRARGLVLPRPGITVEPTYTRGAEAPHAGANGLAGAGDGGAPPQVGAHPTDLVVGGGRHRNEMESEQWRCARMCGSLDSSINHRCPLRMIIPADHFLPYQLAWINDAFDVEARGDLETGAHHTVEDTGVTIGRALSDALGDRRGIRRFGHALVPMDEALAQVAVDLSGRPLLVYNAHLGAAVIGLYTADLTHEFLQALCRGAGATMHVRLLAGSNPHHCIEALFKGVGRALGDAISRDERAPEMIPSTKGQL
jgi:imidazoleglycerol phosphate dehydratase HisB/class 3 adenylate cyclase